jgi:tetratricopeptide (TPR) repeat protein
MKKIHRPSAIIILLLVAFSCTVAFAERPVYTIQIGVFKKFENAAALIAGLRQKGYQSFYREEKSPEGQPWFKVYVGKFPSQKTAREVSARLKAKGVLEVSYIRTIEDRKTERIVPPAALAKPGLMTAPEPSAPLKEESDLKPRETVAKPVHATSTSIPAGALVTPSVKPSAPPEVPAPAAVPSGLDLGIKQYQKENYEETIDILTKYRGKDPKSSLAAFFLGMAYKQTGDIQKAKGHLADAVTLPQPVKNGVVELVDVLYQLGQYEEAKRWIAVAERDDISPAGIAFLKGMILAAEKKCAPAIESFEKSKRFDSAYIQAAEMQIGICYASESKYDLAKKRFEAAITRDPLSDLGSYARRYQDLVEERKFIERPLRLTLSIMEHIDTNMLAQPNYYQPVAQQGSSFWGRDQKSLATTSMARLDFVPTISGPFVFNASYAFASRLHQKYSTSYDTIANSISAVPGINFGRFSVNLAGNYMLVLKNDPSYVRYSENFSVGPLLRFLAGDNHIIELYVAHAGKNYFTTIANPELQDQSVNGLDSYLSWIWMFWDGRGMFNLKYGYNIDHARGVNFESQGHRFTGNAIFPVIGALRLQLGGEVYLQPYRNPNVLFDNIQRSDQTYSGTAGLYWDIDRNYTVIAQYQKIRAFSNIFIYDFDREVYSLGMELKF